MRAPARRWYGWPAVNRVTWPAGLSMSMYSGASRREASLRWRARLMPRAQFGRVVVPGEPRGIVGIPRIGPRLFQVGELELDANHAAAGPGLRGLAKAAEAPALGVHQRAAADDFAEGGAGDRCFQRLAAHGGVRSIVVGIAPGRAGLDRRRGESQRDLLRELIAAMRKIVERLNAAELLAHRELEEFVDECIVAGDRLGAAAGRLFAGRLDPGKAHGRHVDDGELASGGRAAGNHCAARGRRMLASRKVPRRCAARS